MPIFRAITRLFLSPAIHSALISSTFSGRSFRLGPSFLIGVGVLKTCSFCATFVIMVRWWCCCRWSRKASWMASWIISAGSFNSLAPIHLTMWIKMVTIRLILLLMLSSVPPASACCSQDSAVTRQVSGEEVRSMLEDWDSAKYNVLPISKDAYLSKTVESSLRSIVMWCRYTTCTNSEGNGKTGHVCGITCPNPGTCIGADIKTCSGCCTC